MAYGTTYITTQGAILAAKTLQSKTLEFTKYKIGDGTIEDGSVEEIKALTDLKSTKLSFDITKIARETDTQVTVRGLFKNTDAEEGFWLRELGLYAKDPDTQNEILFAYVNYGTEGEYINNSISEKKEHYYDMIITVDNADNVQITTDPSTVYVTEKDLNERAEKLTEDIKQEANGKIAVIQGTMELDGGQGTQTSHNFPDGFNADNCIVIAVGISGIKERDDTILFSTTDNDDPSNPSHTVCFISNKIQIMLTNNASEYKRIQYTYKIFLLKYK